MDWNEQEGSKPTMSSQHKLVVIGRVAAREYSPVRQAILDADNRIKVVRITEEQIRTIVEVFCDTVASDGEHYRDAKLLHKIIDRVTTHKVGGLYSVVYSAKAWQLCRSRCPTDPTTTMTFWLETLPPLMGVDAYVIRNSRPERVVEGPHVLGTKPKS